MLRKSWIPAARPLLRPGRGEIFFSWKSKLNSTSVKCVWLDGAPPGARPVSRPHPLCHQTFEPLWTGVALYTYSGGWLADWLAGWRQQQREISNRAFECWFSSLDARLTICRVPLFLARSIPARLKPPDGNLTSRVARDDPPRNKNKKTGDTRSRKENTAGIHNDGNKRTLRRNK